MLWFMGETEAATSSRVERARRYLGEHIATLSPAYFAMSMATGIVSLACYLLGLRDLAVALFWINVVAYVALWAATIARATLFSKQFLADWSRHPVSPGFFTSVAATSVLGTEFVVLFHATTIATVLLVLSFALWVICTYAVFVALSIREDKPSLADGINGGWLLAVVATQSLVVLGCNVLPPPGHSREIALFFATALWLCGGMLYIWMISLIFYRYTFFRFSPSDLMPPYWINMGAVAISTLAGTALVMHASESPMLASMRPFVKGFTLLYWATATWWIPMLALLGIWRHAVRHMPVSYDPLYWGLVFPFGMYSVCTYRIVETFELPFLAWIARGFVVLAIIAWTFTFFGFLSRLIYFALIMARPLRARRASSERASLFPALERASANVPSHGGSQ